jgi:CPA2 family monovalent cation:H+ antiporter-2
VIGTEMQITKFREFIESEIKNHPLAEQMHEITLTHFSISENSPLDGKSIRQTEIRELTHGLVVGVERNGNRILNPESDFVFEANDSVWLVGDEKRISVFINNL